MVTLDPSRLARLVDEDDIRRLIWSYCRGIDRRDLDLVRACYHPGARDHHGGAFDGTVEDFLDYLPAALAGFTSTMHLVTNMLISVRNDEASSESYCLAQHRLAANDRRGERDYLVGLRFVDQWQRRDARWGIVERTCVFEWTRTDAVPAGWGFDGSWLRGVRGTGDPSYELWPGLDVRSP